MMVGNCATFDPKDDYLPGITRFIECQATAITDQGFHAFGGITGPLVTVLMTIYIALVGYRLLLGEMPTVKGTTLIFVRLGIILALATQWPAYRISVYDVIVSGPSDLTSKLTGKTSATDRQSDLAKRLQYNVDQLAVGDPDGGQVFSNGGVSSNKSVAPPSAAPPVGSATASSPIHGPAPLLEASHVLLISAGSALTLLSLAAALLLGLGPLFVLLGLFEGTRALLEGWIRALLCTTLASIAVNLSLYCELLILEPQVRQLLHQHSEVGLSGEIQATIWIFVFVLVGVSLIAITAGVSFRLPSVPAINDWLPGLSGQDRPTETIFQKISAQPREPVAAVVDAARAAERRDRLVLSVDSVSPRDGLNSTVRSDRPAENLAGSLTQNTRRRRLGRAPSQIRRDATT